MTLKVMKNIALIVILMLCISFAGCTKRGCTDPTAKNYDESAKNDDGSCIYEPESEQNLIFGRYKCTRKSGYGQVVEDDTELEIHPIRVSDKILSVCDNSIGLSFYITYTGDGFIKDTVIPDVPGYMPDGFAARILGSVREDSLHIDYIWTSKQYVYDGFKIQQFTGEFDTPDYRDTWVGFYDGTKENIWWTPDTGGVSGPYNATLEVSLTENDSVLKIIEVGSDYFQNAMYYVNTNGVLRSPSDGEDPYVGAWRGGSFVGDSLNYYIATHSVGAGTETRFYCKKRQ